MDADHLIIMLQKPPFKGISIVIIKRWVKDIFTLDNIVEFSRHGYQVNEWAEDGGPNWKYTQTRLLKKTKNLYKAKKHCSYIVRVGFISHGLSLIRIAFLLHPIGYLSVLVWSLTSRHGTDYSFELHQECVDKCYTQCYCYPPFHLSTHSDTTDK